MAKEQEHRKWSKERWKVFFEKDLPIGITIACFIVFCIVICIDDDVPPTKTGTTHPHNHNERQVEEVSTSTTTSRRAIPVQSRENEMIDRLSREDFYEDSDYYDGLDGEYNDIDYNEVIDYFAD